MRFLAAKVFVFSAVLVLGAGQVQAGTATPAKSAKKHSSKSNRRHRKARKTSWKERGQQGIKPERVLEIQQALIREKYLTGEPTGEWDARTQDALTRYQTDNGWQSKVTPDSRALIKLGLGPNYSGKELLKLEGEPGTGAVASSGSPNQSKQ